MSPLLCLHIALSQVHAKLAWVPYLDRHRLTPEGVQGELDLAGLEGIARAERGSQIRIGGRVYRSLQSGWAGALEEAITDARQMECARLRQLGQEPHRGEEPKLYTPKPGPGRGKRGPMAKVRAAAE